MLTPTGVESILTRYKQPGSCIRSISKIPIRQWTCSQLSPATKIDAPTPRARSCASPCAWTASSRGTKDPAKADEVYQSGVRWLLDQTRPDDGKKFDLLFRDNIAYGFRRNALGTRPLGVFIAIGCLAWALAKEHVLFGAGGKTVDWSKLGGILPEPIASLAVSGLMLLIWVLFVTKTRLRTSAFS
jgi:hypothetical protein